jgi:hypothetical protein
MLIFSFHKAMAIAVIDAQPPGELKVDWYEVKSKAINYNSVLVIHTA